MVLNELTCSENIVDDDDDDDDDDDYDDIIVYDIMTSKIIFFEFQLGRPRKFKIQTFQVKSLYYIFFLNVETKIIITFACITNISQEAIRLFLLFLL